MIFDIRPLNSEDYDTILVDWWKDWGWTPPPKDFLPDNGKGGMMILDGEIPVCAGFIYMTNSNVYLLEFMVSNKKYRKKPHRKNAMGLLIETLTNISKNQGAKYCYSLLKHKSLMGTFESLGYVKGDSNTFEMIKNL
tara:strand:- start:163 stop:573 length:411 start_codon:yes stop_codon:yes gene_type:complete